jgi:hypothetical protein
MTIQKLAKLIQKEIIDHGIESKHSTTTSTNIIIKVLTGLSLLVDQVADPECVFTDKVNIVLNDIARDIRSDQ